MQKTTRLNRLLAAIVAVFMVVCCLPLNAFADSEKSATVNVSFVIHEDNHEEQVGDEQRVKITWNASDEQPDGTILWSLILHQVEPKVPTGYELTREEVGADGQGCYFIQDDDPIGVYVKESEKKIIVNFNNGDGTWTDGVADGDSKQFVLSSNTPDATYTVPADVQAPNGKVLNNWTNNWDSSVLNAGDTFSYNSIAAIVGTTETESYIAFTAQYKDAPAPVEKKIIVNFNNGDGTWTDGVADGDPKQFVLSSNTPDATYTVPADVQAPNGKVLNNWTNNWDSSVLNAGDTFSYNSIAAIVGTTETESYIAFTAQYKDAPAPVEKKIIVNFNNGDGTWTDGVADGDPKQFVLSSSTPDATYTVPADLQAPNGKVLSNWTNNWDSSVLNAGDTFSYNSIAAIVGTTEAESYIAYTAQYVDKPDEGLKKIDVVFVTADGKEVAGHYTLEPGQTNYVYDTVYEGICPEGQMLDHWYLNGDTNKVYATGSQVTFESLAAEVGTNYDKNGVAYISFSPAFVASKSVGLNFYDEENREQAAECYIEVPEDATEVNTSKMILPDGYEFVAVGDFPIRDGWVYVSVKCVKTLRICWAVDNKDASFANGNEDAWTQELTWKHVNDDIAMPEVNVPDGYVLNGWSVSGQEGEFWKASLKTMNVGDKYVEDENGGIISITANIVTKEQAESGSSDNSSNNNNNSNNNKTVSSNNNQVVKAETPADNTAKVMPQTGLSVETPVVFGVMMVAALAGAGAYLFAIRKKLN